MLLLLFLNVLPPSPTNKIIFRTSQEMKLIIIKVKKKPTDIELTDSEFSFTEFHIYFHASKELKVNITVQMKKTVMD